MGSSLQTSSSSSSEEEVAAEEEDAAEEPAPTGEAPAAPATPAGPAPIDWTRSWYEILGIARNAQATSIKAAYLPLCATYHPDKAGPEHTATMQRINHIWSILSCSATRKAYNKSPADFPFPGSTWRADAESTETAEASEDAADPGARGDASKE